MGVILGVLIKLYRAFLLIPMLAIFSKKKQGKIPRIQNSLLVLSATDLADKIRKKEVTSEEVVKVYIQRLREVNAVTNAVTDERFDDAISEAKRADKMVQTMSLLYLSNSYPFLGVPFTVQGTIKVKELPQITSVKNYQKIADQDAEVVRLLRASGAIPIAITNSASLNLNLVCQNPGHTGNTVNPYDLTRCAGSIGGETSLISSCGSIFGIGTDCSGSLRISGLFNGVHAHKPTANVISMDGIYITEEEKTFSCCGIITRYAKDLKPLLHILSDKSPILQLEQPISSKTIKIFYKNRINGIGNRLRLNGIDKDLNSSFNKAVQYFKANSFEVDECNMDISNIYEISKFIKKITEFSDDKSEQFSKQRPQWFNIVGSYRFKKISRLTDSFTSLKEKFKEILGEDGVLLFPTFCKPAVHLAEQSTVKSGVLYTQMFNYLGFPSTQVPLGLSKTGLPLGIQVVAAPFQDRLCIVIANELEQALGGWTTPF